MAARWVVSWDADIGVGAEELAWEPALELEAAEAAGEAICGAALDWRKAFDCIDVRSFLGALRRLAYLHDLLDLLARRKSHPMRIV